MVRSSNDIEMTTESLDIAAFRFLTDHFKQQRDHIVAQVVTVLRLMLPHVAEQEITKAVTKFTKKAINMKIAMTKEVSAMTQGGVYRCYWARVAALFDPERMDIVDEESGPVYLCTFPGLTKQKQKGGEVYNVVKASVVLQSAFAIE